jgi:hypothetical protein
MRSSVRYLFEAADLEPEGLVRWGSSIPPSDRGLATGVYVVALTEDVDNLSGALAKCPLSDDALRELLAARGELTVDGRRPDISALRARIAGFWVPEAVVLYIGLAGARERRPKEGELAKRVSEYYGTSLGARSPHAGGWFLKTLEILRELVIHYAYCDDVVEAEQAMLGAFATAVSPPSRAALVDSERVMPFANLEYPKGVFKRHGIKGAKEPRKGREKEARGPRRKTATAVSATLDLAAQSTRDNLFTQPVLRGDTSAGILRVPKSTKMLFPPAKAIVRVEFEGHDLGECAWDPRLGPDRARSGVLRIGRDAVAGLQEGKRLQVERSESGIRLQDLRTAIDRRSWGVCPDGDDG